MAQSENKRLYRYLSLFIVVGMLFGILDWYFPTEIQTKTLNPLLFIILQYVIWIAPAIIIAIITSVVYRNPKISAITVAFFWFSAVLSYYGYYAVLLAFPGLPQLEDLRIANIHGPYFWQSWRLLALGTFIPRLVAWGAIGMFGGAVIGWATGKLIQVAARRHRASIARRLNKQSL